MRRVLPSTSNPYYSTGSGYSFPTYNRRRTSFGLNISRPGRNLIIAIFAGLVIGAITSVIYFGGLPLVFFLIQIPVLVYQGWGIPSLATSMIVVLSPVPVPIFGSTWLGVEDVAFNAFAVWVIDGLLRNMYTPRQYYVVFFITGLAGNLLSLIGNSSGTASMGASGGIFGLIAGAVTADYAINRRWNVSLVAWFLFIFFASTFLSGLSVDIFAHLGGALVGLVAGYLIGNSRHTRGSNY
jgi:membrane associated rhomboid family serine protease